MIDQNLGRLFRMNSLDYPYGEPSLMKMITFFKSKVHISWEGHFCNLQYCSECLLPAFGRQQELLNVRLKEELSFLVGPSEKEPALVSWLSGKAELIVMTVLR